MSALQTLEHPSTDAQDVEPCHLAHKDVVFPALAAGTPITALCGRVYIPTRLPGDNEVWCRRCLELAREFLNDLHQIRDQE